MTDAPTDTPILMVGDHVQRNEESAPCGCTILGFMGRCALAIPCSTHAGKMVFIAMGREAWDLVLAEQAERETKEDPCS